MYLLCYRAQLRFPVLEKLGLQLGRVYRYIYLYILLYIMLKNNVAVSNLINGEGEADASSAVDFKLATSVCQLGVSS